jgi:hypothetical protein
MLEKKVISKEQGQALANEFGIKFMETSAKSSINVEVILSSYNLGSIFYIGQRY